jgi:uncharacterized protein YjbI with pentapeptide repeats
MAKREHLRILDEGVAAWNRFRAEQSEIRPDLSQADLSRRTLCDCELSRAKLTAADLYGADLSGASLRGANLSGANLSGARLVHTDLSGANLARCDLTGATLVGCQGEGANFKEARLWATQLLDLDLSELSHLETVVHHGPSYIGVDTFYSSKGKIPEIFLRGTGVPKSLIELQRSLVAEQAWDYFSVFVSFHPADRFFANRLHGALVGRGLQAWLDEHQGSDRFRYDEMERSRRRWDKVILCCSRALKTTPWADREVERALAQEERIWHESGQRVQTLLPVNLDGYLFRGEGLLGSALRDRLATDFTGWEQNNARFEEPFERLLEALQRRLSTGRIPRD